jgi:predicted dehydrogenase
MTKPHLSATAHPELTRRRFLAGTGAATLGFSLLQPELAGGAQANSTLNIGLIGCGGRGKWIANLFLKDGHYNLAAVADYFADRADEVGSAFNVPAGARFSGLNGYQRLLEQKLDAVVIETPPFFHPIHAAAGVEAGKHVYVAKPIAVDVPGCLSIEASGKKATAKKLAFLIDFQTRAHPFYQEAVRRVHNGEIGKLVSVEASYLCGPTWGGMDPVLRQDPKNPEVRLRAWGVDKVLSGDVITEQNIHALDVASWMLNAPPVKAYGTGGKTRHFIGDCWDHFAVIFYYPNDLALSFNSKQVGHGIDDIMCRVYGVTGTADTHYFGKVWVRSTEEIYNPGELGNLFTDGVVRNIATFYENVTKGEFTNPTVAPSVRSNLTTILGRTAAYQRREVTWDELLKVNEKLEFDLSTLKG